MSEKLKRRWLRFSLRTLLVLVAILALPLAWVAYSLNWINDRHAVLADTDAGYGFVHSYWGHNRVAAPGALGLFGERGTMWFVLKEYDQGDLGRIRRLFPESEVSVPIADKSGSGYSRVP